MGYGKDCPKCGTVHWKNGKYCSEACALAAVGDAVHQLKVKKGPVYEKWKARLKESIERI